MISSGQKHICQRCGACCRWPGQVRVSPAEINAIATFLGLPEDVFIQHKTRLRADRKGLALLDKPSGECEFLDGSSCSIHPVKPQQCRDFPDLWNAGPETICKAIVTPAS